MTNKIFVVISFDGRQLLLPQETVGTIEAIGNLEATDTEVVNAIGVMQSAGFEWPVFALNQDFAALSERPGAYKYGVGINQDNEAAFAIACEEVSTVSIENDSELKPVQECMRLASNPVEYLLLRDHKLMLVSSAEKMLQFFIPEDAAS